MITFQNFSCMKRKLDCGCQVVLVDALSGLFHLKFHKKATQRHMIEIVLEQNQLIKEEFQHRYLMSTINA